MAAKKKVTLRYGPENELTKAIDAGVCVSGLLQDRGIQSMLGFGDNVVAKIDGDVVSGSTVPDDGDIITIETRAHEKA